MEMPTHDVSKAERGRNEHCLWILSSRNDDAGSCLVAVGVFGGSLVAATSARVWYRSRRWIAVWPGTEQRGVHGWHRLDWGRERSLGRGAIRSRLRQSAYFAVPACPVALCCALLSPARPE